MPKKIRKLPKKIVALRLLVQRSLIQPEAHFLYGESCLHSTISTLANNHAISFERVPERYGLHNAHFTRYKLSEQSRATALALISQYESALEKVAV